MIFGERVKLAREIQGWTQGKLAEQVGVSQSAIAQIESGVTQPHVSTLDAIALSTKFPPSFFRQPSPQDFPLGSLSFLYRSRASTRARDLGMAHAWATLVWDIVKEMMRQLQPIPVTLPRLSGERPLTAARVTRSELRLPPNAPIDRVLMPVERAGVLAVALPISVEGLDAFSVWAGEEGRQPVIVSSREPAGDRLRFSLAHELGHLVMHSPILDTVSQLEKEADQFAAEFLLPEEGIRRDIVSPVTLSSLAALKPKWRVSIAALVRRARDLSIISETQYRMLMKQVSARGWRTQEPENLAVTPEKPRAIRKMIEVLYGNPADYERFAGAMSLMPARARDIINAHAAVDELAGHSTTRLGAKKVLRLHDPHL